MPSINMIAPRRSEQKRLEVNLRRLIIAILLEIVLLLGIMGIMFTRIYSVHAKIADMDVQQMKLQPTVRRIDECEKELSALKPKLETLTKAKNDTLRWCRVMDALARSMPDKAWLTRLTANQPSDPASPNMTVSINGVAPNQNLVGQAMLRIHDNVTDFDMLDLHYTQKTNVGTRSAVEFELGAGIKLNPDSKEGVDKS